ncbi:MAG: CapA family protein [Angelakisella sp.]
MPRFNKKILAGVAAVLVLSAAGAALLLRTPAIPVSGQSEPAASSAPQSELSQPATPPPAPEPPAPPPPKKATLVAVGDNLIHNTIYQQAAARATNGGYDFAPAYRRIAPLIAGADFAFINQETVLAGSIAPPASYPMFNSPTEVGDTVLDLGFNLISTANNHCFDKWEKGLVANLAYWDDKPRVAVAGTYRNATERNRIAALTKNGITVSMVAATQYTNGLALQDGSEAGVNLLSELDWLCEQIKAAREVSDFVICSLHWGDEGSGTPNLFQKETAKRVAAAGADLILGHHPHVLQGGEWLDTEAGRSYVIYSLGNFISAQSHAFNMAGGVLNLELTMEQGERAKIVPESVKFLPTVTHYGSGYSDLCLYPLSEYTPELAAAHGVRSIDPEFGYDYLEAQLANLQFNSEPAFH